MITKQMKKQQHMVMTALITILLAVFGSVQNAVGEVTVKPSGTEWYWDGTANRVKHDGKFITVKVDNAGEFATYINKKDCDLLKTYGSTTTFIYDGKANSTDLAALSKLTNKQINLSKVVLDDSNLSTPEAVINAIKLNPNAAEYLALPDAGVELTKSDDHPFKSLCDTYTNLKGVAYYYRAGKSYTCYSSKAGEVYILTFMSFCSTNDGDKEYSSYHKAGTDKFPLENLKMSGNLNAKDISTNLYGNKYTSEGHFAFTNDYFPADKDAKIKFDDNPSGTTDNLAWDGTSTCLTKMDLEDATFDEPEDMTLAFSGLIGAQTTTVIIPKNATEIPSDFLHVAAAIKEICIPYSVTKIGYRAFYGLTELNHVTTTDKDGNVIDKGFGKNTKLDKFTDDNGNEYQDQVVTEGDDPTAGSVVFSENITEIDSWAFASMEKVKDVYNLAPTAPVCQVNAFGSSPCTGNNGYNPKGGITRADYSNNGKWIAMLHYPKSIQGTDEEKRYTDVTRDYTISDADGNTDAQGNLLHWPSQSEFLRAYQQATNGYLWNAWEAKRTAWTVYGTCELDGEYTGKGYLITQDECNDLYYKNTTNENRSKAIFYHTSTKTNSDGSIDVSGDVDKGAWQETTYSGTKEPLYNGDYRGWHQFVLASSYDYESETPSHNFSYINDNGWWTICVPFNMTKAEVRKMFGTDGSHGGPHVCELTSVTRDANADNGKGKGKIVLHFDRDVYNKKYDEKGKETGDRKDNEDVIEAGVPYLLQPDFKMNTDGIADFKPSDQVLKDDRCKAVSQAQLRSQLLTKFVTVDAVDEEGNKDKHGKKYYFIGNYWLTEMPQYAYFLAWYDKENVATFFWQEEKPKQTLNWNAYTAIIGCDWSDTDRKFYIPNTGNTNPTLGNVHWFTRKGNDVNGGSVFGDDSFKNSNGAGAKANGPENVSIEAAGNTTDGITKVHFGDRTIEIFHGKVYNLNGQYVGDSLEGLPKGIYIAAGKKYVVK